MSKEIEENRRHEEDEESLPETLTESLPEEKQKWKRMPMYDEQPKSFLSRMRHNLQWVAHGLLLSTSLIFFAASYRMQNAKPSDVAYTKAFSSWCESQSHRPAMASTMLTTTQLRRREWSSTTQNDTT